MISGRPALEADELAVSDRDARLAEVAGLSLVFMVLWAFLGVRNRKDLLQFCCCGAGLLAVWILYFLGIFGINHVIAGTCICMAIFVVPEVLSRNKRGLWLAIAAELCLGVGIGWTFGWATISVGRLNLLSLVFVIALIGIGMDYLIQILTRATAFEKKRYTRPQAVWRGCFGMSARRFPRRAAGRRGRSLSRP